MSVHSKMSLSMPQLEFQEKRSASGASGALYRVDLCASSALPMTYQREQGLASMGANIKFAIVDTMHSRCWHLFAHEMQPKCS